MFHSHDRQTLEMQLGMGADEFPKKLEEEYTQWLRQHHAADNGALGPALCLVLTKMLGIESRLTGEKATAVMDWGGVDGGEPVTVIEDDGEVKFGYFRGKTGAGRIAVELEGNEFIHEYPHRSVRLRSSNDKQGLPNPKEAPIAEAKPIATNPVTDAVDWEKIPKGRHVLVDTDGDVVTGTYTGLSKAGEVIVSIDGSLDPANYAPELIALGD